MRRLRPFGKGALLAALLFTALWLALAVVLPWKNVLRGALTQMSAGLPFTLTAAGSMTLQPYYQPKVAFKALILAPHGMNTRLELQDVEVTLSWWQLLDLWRGAAVQPRGTAASVRLISAQSTTELRNLEFTLIAPPPNGMAALGSYEWQQRRYNYDIALEGIPEEQAVKFAVLLGAGKAPPFRAVGATLRRGSVTALQFSRLSIPGFGSVAGTIRLDDTNAHSQIDAAFQVQQDTQEAEGEAGAFFKLADARAIAAFIADAQLSGRIRVSAPRLRLHTQTIESLAAELVLQPNAPLLLSAGGMLAAEPLSLRVVIEPHDNWQLRGGELHVGEAALSFSGQGNAATAQWTVLAEGLPLSALMSFGGADGDLLNELREASTALEVNFQLNNTAAWDMPLGVLRGTLRVSDRKLYLDPLILRPVSGNSALRGNFTLDAAAMFPKIDAAFSSDAALLAALYPMLPGLPGTLKAEISGHLPHLETRVQLLMPSGRAMLEGAVDFGKTAVSAGGTFQLHTDAAALSAASPWQWQDGAFRLSALSGTLAGQPLQGQLLYSEKEGVVGALDIQRASPAHLAALLSLPFSNAAAASSLCAPLWGEPLTTLPLLSLLSGMPLKLDLTIQALPYNTRLWQPLKLSLQRRDQQLSLSLSGNDRGSVVQLAAGLKLDRPPLPELQLRLNLQNAYILSDTARLSGELQAGSAGACLADVLMGGGQVQLNARGLSVPGASLGALDGLVRQTALQQVALGVLRTSGIGALLRLEETALTGRFSGGVLAIDRLETRFAGGQAALSGDVRLFDNTLSCRANVRLNAYPNAPLLVLDIGGTLNSPRIGIADRAFGLYLLQQGLLQKSNNR